MCLRLELFKLLSKKFIRNIFFFFQIVDLKYFVIFFLFALLLEFAQNFPFFPNKNCQIKINRNKKEHVNWEGGLIQLFNAKISPNYVTFTFKK
jgi:hypothetical protein